MTMGNIITFGPSIAISNVEIELSTMNEDTDWVFVEDESFSEKLDRSEQIPCVQADRKNEDVLNN